MKPHEKKILKFLFSLFLIAGSFGWQNHVDAVTLAERLRGRIVLEVESHGEAYYIYPVDLKRYYLGRPADAFNVMRNLGLGISNIDLSKIPKNTDNWNINLGISSNKSLISKVSGRILLQVQSYGEAWYINPLNNRRYYLGRPTDAFNLMRSLGLGITTANLLTVPQGSLGGSAPAPAPVSATIVLLSPNGGESLVSGSTYNITWHSPSTSVSKINLFYSTDHWASSSMVIASGEANDGGYSWVVPDISSSTVRLKVEGIDSTGAVLASDVSDTDFAISGTSAEAPAYPLVNPQEMKILAVRVTSSNPSSSLPTVGEISNALFGSSDYSVKNFYSRNSYEQISVSGEVLDTTLDIALPSVNYGVNFAQMFSALDEKIDFSKYNNYHILFVVMEQGVSGQGTFKNGYPFESGEGSVNVLPAVVTTDCIKNFISNNTLIHELGHGFGLRHVGAWLSTLTSCGSIIPLNNLSDASCVSTYGGGTVMSSLDEPGDLYVYQRKKLSGVQSLSKTLTVTFGTYSLGYFTRVLGASEYEELSIPATNGVYSVEFRQSMDIGMEKQNAVAINFIPTSDSFFSSAFPGDLIYSLAPELLLVAPRANVLTQVAPSLSGIFTDSLRNIKLEVLEIDGSHAKVKVSSIY